MSKCKKCGRHGLFLFVDSHTGLCPNCQKEIATLSTQTAPPTIERTIEIPTVYIGNGMKSVLVEKFEDVELKKPESFPDFSKFECCDNVNFSIDDKNIVAKHLRETLGYVTGDYLVSEIAKSFKQKRPIFSQILGYDDETGEIHIVIAFYKIVRYDYDQYTENLDDSLNSETVDYY